MTGFASEPGDELCPPYWPEIVWWLVHHHGDPPKRDDLARIDEFFAVLTVNALVQRVSDERIASGVRAALGDHPALSLVG